MKDAIEIANALKNNTTLTEIALYKNNIGDETKVKIKKSSNVIKF